MGPHSQAVLRLITLDWKLDFSQSNAGLTSVSRDDCRMRINVGLKFLIFFSLHPQKLLLHVTESADHYTAIIQSTGFDRPQKNASYVNVCRRKTVGGMKAKI